MDQNQNTQNFKKENVPFIQAENVFKAKPNTSDATNISHLNATNTDIKTDDKTTIFSKPSRNDAAKVEPKDTAESKKIDAKTESSTLDRENKTVKIDSNPSIQAASINDYASNSILNTKVNQTSQIEAKNVQNKAQSNAKSENIRTETVESKKVDVAIKQQESLALASASTVKISSVTVNGPKTNAEANIKDSLIESYQSR